MTDLSNTINNIITSTEMAIVDIASTDFLSVFGGAGNLSVNNLTQYIQSFTNTIPISTVETYPTLSSTTSDVDTNTILYNPNVSVRSDITGSNTSANGVVNPTTRYVNPIGNEPPVAGQVSYYPYNKAYVSESGHLKEIDDTPGNERLLDQHVSGTYQEMKASGDHVIKVVGDSYTIVAGADHITVQGSILVHGEQECNMRIGGSINIITDGGCNLVSKGALRVRASSLAFESTSGDISFLSAANLTMTAAGSTNIKSQSTAIQSDNITSIKAGQNLVIEAQKISEHSMSDIVAQASGGIYMQSQGDTDIISGGKTVLTGSSIEVAGILNAQGQTNMLASGTPVQGQGSASGSSQSPDQFVPAQLSNGSGITGSNNPDDVYMMNDDDTQSAMTAIQTGLKNGTIQSADLIPPAAGQSDAAGAPNVNFNAIPTSIIALPSGGALDNLQLSPNFTLGRLSKHALASPTSVVAQHGLSQLQMVQNLQMLALNSLELIKKKFPDMQITSGFRLGSSNSQHERGMACDMQFASANANRNQYFTYAQLIRDNVPYDQLLLEYKNSGTKLPWIHISYNGGGNRRQVLTLFNGLTHGSGLIDLSGSSS